MKQIFTILAAFLLFTFTSNAQVERKTPREPGAKIEALKIAFYTRKLDLSTEEAQKFWPVYNKYSAELKKVRQDAKANNSPEIETEEKYLNIRKRYNAEFSKVLPAEKVNAFFKAEKEFGTILQKEWMERRQKRQERNGTAS
ncbi:MAG: hypothetical protein ACTHMC_06615 [Pseudobacter sp.]|uniref:hypothetical protein n=1 Tax=Pseudobacter sp. TaxID=2045420 RepID=UPI003F7E2F48